MRFPQEIKGKYYQTKKPSGCMTMDTPQGPVAYCLSKTKDKIEVWIGGVPGYKDNGSVNFSKILHGEKITKALSKKSKTL